MILSLFGLSVQWASADGAARASGATDMRSIEFESLTANAFPPNIEYDMEDAVSSNGLQSVVAAFDQDHWVEYSVYVANAGTYRVDVTSRKGTDQGIYQLYIDDHIQGPEVDLYAKNSDFTTADLGDVTFLAPGYKVFRFQVAGVNEKSYGLVLSFDRMDLTASEGFTVLSPNKSYIEGGQPVFKWNAFPKTNRYEIYVDGSFHAKVSSKKTDYRAKGISEGSHVWHVEAIGKGGLSTRSNRMSFSIGKAPGYSHRDFEDDFESGNLDGFSNYGMSVSEKSIVGVYSAFGKSGSHASVKGVTLGDLGEGEVEAIIDFGSSSTRIGVGFLADDGTGVYAVADAAKDTISIERRVKDYSILDTRITPPEYQRLNRSTLSSASVSGLAEWSERKEGDYYVWTLNQAPFKIKSSNQAMISLTYSRKSRSVVAKIKSMHGSKSAVVRDTVDLRKMDRPSMVCFGGKGAFDSFSFRNLNTSATKWDPASAKVVLKPTPGEWDGQAACNPAVLIKDGLWHMLYSGRSDSELGDGSREGAVSHIGYAYSEDGENWTKFSQNPVISSSPSMDGKVDSIQDPELVLGIDGYVYAILRDRVPYDGEAIYRSRDFVKWEHIEDIPHAEKSKPGKGVSLGALLDTHTSPKFEPSYSEGVEIMHDGISYRYLGAVGEGRFVVSNDIASGNWDYLDESVDYGDTLMADWPEKGRFVIGDMFFDENGDIRASVQAGSRKRNSDRSNTSVVEVVLDGKKPWKVLRSSSLPYLQAWYGSARTGSLDDYTAWSGPAFPGNSVEKDGWLWMYHGGNDTMVSVVKCYNGPRFQSRNLTLSNFSPSPRDETIVSALVRNVGNKKGTMDVELKVDGLVTDLLSVSLEKEEEQLVSFALAKPAGVYTIAIGTASVTMVVK